MEPSSELLKEWDYDKNEALPHETKPSTPVWWKCEKGHSWKYEYRGRVEFPTRGKCKKCKSIAYTKPDFMEEWDFQKNTVDPEDVLPSSTIKRWWKCKNGHSWEAPTLHRTKGQKNCVECTRLSVTHADIVRKEWDYKKNSVLPSEITLYTKYDAWWICENNHSYIMRTDHKILRGSKCLQCSSISFNYPEIAKEFDEEKNGLKAISVRYGSDDMVWWKCDKGHSWQTPVFQRTIIGKGKCQQCNSFPYTHPHLLEEWDYEKNGDKNPYDFSYGSHETLWWKCEEKEHSFSSPLKQRTRTDLRRAMDKCPRCNSNTSKREQEVQDYVRSLGFDPICNTRNVAPPYETDIFVPEHNVVIEYNGLYWHTERNFKNKSLKDPRKHHFNKWKAYKEKGLSLIVIWGDDWENRQSLIKNMLAHKLNKAGTNNRIFARNAYIDNVGNKTSRVFCDQNHMQGYKDGSFHVGLRDEISEELVAVMTWRIEKDKAYLERFATNRVVVGGFTKLLKNSIPTLKGAGANRIITFADHSISDGALYENNGFTVDSVISPQYSVLYKGERSHQLGFKKKRFDTDPTLEYREGMSALDLIELNDLEIIWDYGKTRYMLPL